MNNPLRSSILLAVGACILSCTSFAQTTAPSATTTPSSAAAGSTPSKPVGSSEKKFVKDAGEQVLAVRRLTEITRHQGPGGEPLKKLNAQILTDFDKIWGDLGAFAEAHKVELPKTEASANDKALVAKIKKTDEKNFDKTLLKALDKETKKTAQVFEAADKSVQDADVKKIISDWTPKVKDYASQVTAAEDEASKRK